MVRIWRKENPHASLIKMQIFTATREESMESPQKIKDRTAILSISGTPEYLSEEYESTNMKKYIYMHFSVHCSIIYNSQDSKAT